MRGLSAMIGKKKIEKCIYDSKKPHKDGRPSKADNKIN